MALIARQLKNNRKVQPYIKVPALSTTIHRIKHFEPNKSGKNNVTFYTCGFWTTGCSCFGVGRGREYVVFDRHFGGDYGDAQFAGQKLRVIPYSSDKKRGEIPVLGLPPY